MLDVITALILFSTVIIFGVFGELIFDKTKIPDVLWLVLLGLLAGPVFGIVSFDLLWKIAPYFSAIALIVILFEGGLNLNIYDVIKETPLAFALAFLGFFFTIILTMLLTFVLFLLGFFPDWTIFNSLLLGSIIGGSSSLIVMPLISKTKLRKKVSNLLTVESAFTDALGIVIVIALIKFFTLSHSNIQMVLKDIFSSFAVGIIFGVIIGVIWLYVLKYFKSKSSTLIHHYMLTFACLLFLYAFVEFIGGSPALAVLSFGLILGNAGKLKSMLKLAHNIKLDKKVSDFNSQVSFFIKTFFFAFIGMMFVFNLYSLLIGLLLTLLIVISRPIAVKIISLKESFNKNELNLMSFLMPRGLAAAVLAILPFQANIPGTEGFTAYVFTVIISTIILTTIAYYFISRKKQK